MNQLIKTIEKYIQISEGEKELIQRLFSEISISKGNKLLSEGQICKYLYFVSKGILRQFISSDNKEQTIHFNSENSFICDFNSFTEQKPSTKNIEALENATFLRISKPNLEKFYAQLKQGERFGRLLVEDAFNKSIKHIYSLKNDSPEKRYFDFIATYKNLQQSIPQYYIASFIGVTPQSLSRIRRRMASQ